VNVTTRLLDDTAARVSRYLQAQIAVNIGFGAATGLGLFLIGVPNPFLWGLLAMFLRYIPYLGIWVAACFPALLAFAVEPGWVKVPLVFGLYLGIDLLIYNFVEPVLYGSSTGMSPLAILFSAVFWTWLWGPVGLLLATPVTVCVAVVGRHVPNLEFLGILLSDEPGLAPPTRFYQRILARDPDEATEIAKACLKDHSLEELFDGVLVPALSLAGEDRHQGKLDELHQQFLLQHTRRLVEEMSERAAELVAPPQVTGLPVGASVVCVAARDEADEIVALMLVRLLGRRGLKARGLSAEALTSEFLEKVGQERLAVVCLCAVPPFDYVHLRYLCRRLRPQFRHLQLVGVILAANHPEDLRQRQPLLPVDELAVSLDQAVSQVLALVAGRSTHELQGVAQASKAEA
jgi:hypothetical protein